MDIETRTPEQLAELDRINKLEWELINTQKQGFDAMCESLSNEQLGKLVREYVQESEHQGWEGFGFQDLIGISKMLGDMVLARKHIEL